MNNFEISVICDILKERVFEYALSNEYGADDLDSIEEKAYEEVIEYMEENEIEHTDEDIDRVVKEIMEILDLSSIDEQIEDKKFIKEHGMYRYLGLDARDF